MERCVNLKKQLAGSQTETPQSLPGVWFPVGLLEQLFGTCTKTNPYTIQMKIQDASN